MAKWTQQVSDIVIRNPYVDSFMASVGGGPGGPGGGGTNNGRLMLQLVPRAVRPVSTWALNDDGKAMLATSSAIWAGLRLMDCLLGAANPVSVRAAAP